MERYADGDADAFDEVWRTLAPVVRACQRRWIGDTALAEDLVQETFLRVHHARARYRSGAPVGPWVLTIARRLARNLGPQDTLARIGHDQFALLLLSQTEPRELAMLAEQVRRSVRSPVSIGGQEIVLTASVGLDLLSSISS